MNNIDLKLIKLIEDILINGRVKKDRTGTGTISIFGTEIKHDMREGFPLSTLKKMFLKGISVELEWFLKGDTNIKYLVDRGVNIWNGDAYKNYNGPYITMDDYIKSIKNDADFAAEYGNLGPVYGHQWTNYGGDYISANDDSLHCRTGNGINQIQQVIDTLNNNPDSRRILVNSWNVNELDDMALPPCHFAFQLYSTQLTESERGDLYKEMMKGYIDTSDLKTSVHFDHANIPKRGLSLKWTQRSADVGLGVFFNLASYGLLLEIIAKQVNMVPLDLIGSFGDTHIYLNHVEQCEELIKRVPKVLPTITLDNDVTVNNFLFSKLQLNDYQYHPSIKMDLSN